MKRAIVTGGSRGIGFQVARMLLELGWGVETVSRTKPPIRAGKGQHYAWVSCDLSQPVPPALFDDGRTVVDALIHCAAIQGPIGRLGEADLAAWEQTIKTNLLGTAEVVRALLPPLLRSDDGRILLFSGGGAFGPRADYTAYAASKAGVVALMESLAEELDGTSVTVNCVAPGYVPTTMHVKPLPDRGEAMAMALACVRHLLSPQARGLTGKTISAPYDDWASVSPLTVPLVNASEMGTRDRHPLSQVDLLRRKAPIEQFLPRALG